MVFNGPMAIGSQHMGLQLCQLKLRLGKTPSRSLGESGSPPCGCLGLSLGDSLVLVMDHETKHRTGPRPRYCPLCPQAHGFALWPSCEDFPAGHPSQYYFHMNTLNCQFLGTPLAPLIMCLQENEIVLNETSEYSGYMWIRILMMFDFCWDDVVTVKQEMAYTELAK
ncbi:hypothetical protein Tco_0743323 [Tanacetum coccineum]